MTDGQFIAVDFGSGRGLRLQVHDQGNGHFTASDPTNENKVMAVEPTSGIIEWSPAGKAEEFEQFTVDGNIMCFYSTGGNPHGQIRLFAFSNVVKGVNE